MSTQKQKAWGAEEISHLFHLVNWGYDNKMTATIAAEFIQDRTVDGLHGRISDIRKYISNQKGYKVSNYTLSGRTEKLFKIAGSYPPADVLLKHKPNTKWDFIPMVVRKADRTGTKVKPEPIATAAQDPEKPAYTNVENPNPLPQQALQPAAKVEPDIIDVMRLAKELGATEVEYKGVKIKY